MVARIHHGDVLHVARPLQLRSVRLLDVYRWLVLGSAPDGLARYAGSGWVAQRFGETFPWGTITDAEDKIEALLPSLDEMTSGGFATLERVQVRRYGPRQRSAS
jgi:hypothetical protein